MTRQPDRCADRIAVPPADQLHLVRQRPAGGPFGADLHDISPPARLRSRATASDRHNQPTVTRRHLRHAEPKVTGTRAERGSFAPAVPAQPAVSWNRLVSSRGANYTYIPGLTALGESRHTE